MVTVRTDAGTVVLDRERQVWWPTGDGSRPGEPMCWAHAEVGRPLTVLVPDAGGPIGIRLVECDRVVGIEGA